MTQAPVVVAPQLNDEQARAVQETGRPLLVLAGPGTGKTHMMVEKFRHLVVEGNLDPERILVTTFTRKATEELESRLTAALLDAGHYSSVEVQNFHGLCLSILEEFGGEAGRYREPVVLEGVALHRFLFEHRGVLEWETVPFVRWPDYPLDQLLRVMGRCISEGIPPEEAVRRAERLVEAADSKQERRMRELLDYARNYGRVLELLDREGVLTYDLMLFRAVRLLEEDAAARDEVAARYDYLLVDEVQDNNGLQARLVELIVGERRCVTVVGDEDQGIYKFRGAQLGILRRFGERFSPETVTLTQNYRSAPAVLSVAKRVIAHNTDRHDKPLSAAGDHKDADAPAEVWSCPDEEQEAIRIAASIEEELGAGRKPRDVAVLYRSLNHKDRLLAELEARGIPYEVTNLRQLMAMREVRDLWAWLSVLCDPYADNPAVERVLSGVELGIPLLELGRVQRAFLRERRKQLQEQDEDPQKERINVVDVLRGLAGVEADDHVRHRLDWARKTLETLSRKTRGLTALETAYEVLGWLKVHRRHPPDEPGGRQVLANLGDFLQVVKDYEENYPEARGLRGFLDYLDYLERRGADFQERDPDESEDSVKILTTHRAKGLEFPVVFVAGLSKRRFPTTYRSDILEPLLYFGQDVDARALHMEEERRVFYVAVTRAEERLVLTYPRSVGSSERDRSEFVDEVLAVPSRERQDGFGAGGDDAAVGESGSDVAYSEFEESLPSSESETARQEEQLHAEMHGALVVNADADAQELSDRIRRVAQVAVSSWNGHVDSDVLGDVVARFGALGLEATPIGRGVLDVGYEGPLKLSASALNTYAKCPRQFQFNYILRIPQKMSASAIAGSNVHRALEEFHQRYADDWRTRSLEDLMAVYDETRATKRFASDEEAASWREREERILRQYLDSEKPKDGEPKHFEAEFRVRFEDLDAEFQGFIDRIDEHDDGSLEVIDYKTGRRETPNKVVAEDFQMPLYVLAMEERGERVQAVSMYWMRDAGDGKGPIQRDRIARVGEGKAKGEFTDEALGVFRGRVREAVEGIRKGDFHEEPDEFTCGFCSYRLLCPAMERD